MIAFYIKYNTGIKWAKNGYTRPVKAVYTVRLVYMIVFSTFLSVDIFFNARNPKFQYSLTPNVPIPDKKKKLT